MEKESSFWVINYTLFIGTIALLINLGINFDIIQWIEMLLVSAVVYTCLILSATIAIILDKVIKD